MILLLTAGGPGDATRLVVQNMYQSAFGRLQPGYGVAQAIVLLPVILFVAWLQMRLFKQEGGVWNWGCAEICDEFGDCCHHEQPDYRLGQFHGWICPC